MVASQALMGTAHVREVACLGRKFARRPEICGRPLLGVSEDKSANSKPNNQHHQKMIKKIIAIDGAYAHHAARDAGFEHFPIPAFRDIVKSGDDVDVLESFITIIEKVPENDSPEAVATESTRVKNMQYALEMRGCHVLVCPDKRSQSVGVKHSDDQRLMISTLSTCLRLRPDFLVFVGADGDYAPMLWELRKEGIRTEVVATTNSLANDLKRVAFTIISLDELFERIKTDIDLERAAAK